MQPTPNCRCSACFGFREAIEQITGHDHPGLEPAPGHAPYVDATGPACTGDGYTCICERHSMEREQWLLKRQLDMAA
jgi:hypothetical protein